MKTIYLKFTYNSLKYLLCICCILIIICFKEHFLWIINGSSELGENGNSKTIALNQAVRKIQLLTSVLRRFKVPEDTYVSRHLPKIFIVTATYARPVQKAELTRLKNVFLHVPALHWVVVEDSPRGTDLVERFLLASGISYTHLNKETPPEWKLQKNDPRWYKPRGVLQRNEGIRWLRENQISLGNGVVYFADDDNTYSIELFEEMRYTKKVSVWPVGLVGGVMVERPIVNGAGHVEGFAVGWRPDRAFPIDMAGFAINVALLTRTTALFSHNSKRGFLESDFLEKIASRDELEPKADGCTKVLVWHTQTKEPKLDDEKRLQLEGRMTDHRIEV